MKIGHRKLCSVCVLFALIFSYQIWSLLNTRVLVKLFNNIGETTQIDTKMKNILLWTSHETLPFQFLKIRNIVFKERRCSFENCNILWKNANLFGNLEAIDAILFHAPEIMYPVNTRHVPETRSPNTSYIFVSRESSHYYPVPNSKYNDIFNFTWTYKLKSDISFKYITIKDRGGREIGPGANIPWIDVKDMKPINETIKSKLARKHIAAAWFVSNCKSRSKRENLVANMTRELQKYNMTVDIYGECGNHKCAKTTMEECLKKIQRDYYFYLSLENSFSEDYVTEKLLTALQNFAVPIVYGGADYSRFMPDGIYLNALNISSAELVKQMVDIISDKDKYHSFFKWHNHYSYHEAEDFPETSPYCQLCTFVNNIDLTREATVRDFYSWWNS